MIREGFIGSHSESFEFCCRLLKLYDDFLKDSLTLVQVSLRLRLFTSGVHPSGEFLADAENVGGGCVVLEVGSAIWISDLRMVVSKNGFRAMEMKFDMVVAISIGFRGH